MRATTSVDAICRSATTARSRVIQSNPLAVVASLASTPHLASRDAAHDDSMARVVRRPNRRALPCRLRCVLPAFLVALALAIAWSRRAKDVVQSAPAREIVVDRARAPLEEDARDVVAIARGDRALEGGEGRDDAAEAGRAAEARARDADGDGFSAPSSWISSRDAEAHARRGAGCSPPGANDVERASPGITATPSAGLDALRPSGSAERGVLVVRGGSVEERIEAAKKSHSRAVVVAVTSEAERRACEEAGVPSHLPPARAEANADGWLTASWVLSRGHVVLLASHRVEFESNALFEVGDDGADVSGTIRGDGKIKAHVVGMGDPAMGWSQYSQSMVTPLVRATFLVLRPTVATASLVDWLASDEVDFDGTDDAITDELLMPAHDARQRAGVSFRMLNTECFGERGTVARVPDGATAWDGKKADANAVIAATPDFRSAKAHVLRKEKCGVAKESKRVGPKPRPLRYIASPTGEYPVGCDTLPDLCAVVGRVAKNREVLAAVSNKNIFYMLGLYIDGLKKTNITNFIVVALDKETAQWCEERDVPYYHRELRSITGSTDNHATSGLKFRILNEFVTTGTSVLLSDVDVVWMQDPFASGPSATNERMIYRDSDVEGMTDGWDDPSSYGFSWNGLRRLVARNSGLFYVAATRETKTMMSRLAERMESEKNTWDQTAYNQEQVYLWGQADHKTYSGTSQRVMNYVCFQNSKYMFRYMRYDSDLYPNHRPASVHINYHPEKPDRMVSVIAQYWNGKKDAIEVWNWGEGRKGIEECAKRPASNGIADSRLAQALVKKTSTRAGMWGGNRGLVLGEDGTLKTPWGEGKWGILPHKDGSIYMDFIGAAHVLELQSGSPDDANAQFEFKSKRCKDDDEVDVHI